ncbi:hypothetical protein CDN99_20070 [Roseateles aquatilis]|uniref:Uncharacterized protein n=1 Tax=Roseateles aquatilis TaxID=431061 RepID=A0A246J331_9BURK|nr:hypothetical protein [Roseateles aquatilis]OWQ86995.1 hypothetical protein CDN99_20070 [Roseateles aquatilis]
MKRFLLISAFLLSSLPLVSHAYTECAPMRLTKVWSDVDGNFFIAVNGGYLNGAIRATANPALSKPAIAIAIAAYMANRKVIVRYSRDGVNCDAPVWDEVIGSIGMAGD